MTVPGQTFSGSIPADNTITKSPLLLKPPLPPHSRPLGGRLPADTLSGEADPGPKPIENPPRPIRQTSRNRLSDGSCSHWYRSSWPGSGEICSLPFRIRGQGRTTVPVSKRHSSRSLSRWRPDRYQGTGYAHWILSDPHRVRAAFESKKGFGEAIRSFFPGLDANPGKKEHGAVFRTWCLVNVARRTAIGRILSLRKHRFTVIKCIPSSRIERRINIKKPGWTLHKTSYMG